MSGEDLRKLMDAHGIKTQAELAEVVGVHPITVHRWESGKTNISEALVLLIHDRLSKMNNRKG